MVIRITLTSLDFNWMRSNHQKVDLNNNEVREARSYQLLLEFIYSGNSFNLTLDQVSKDDQCKSHKYCTARKPHFLREQNFAGSGLKFDEMSDLSEAEPSKVEVRATTLHHEFSSLVHS